MQLGLDRFVRRPACSDVRVRERGLRLQALTHDGNVVSKLVGSRSQTPTAVHAMLDPNQKGSLANADPLGG